MVALYNVPVRDEAVGPGDEEYVNLKEFTQHRPIKVSELYDYVMEKRSKIDAFEYEFKVIQCKHNVYTFLNNGFTNILFDDLVMNTCFDNSYVVLLYHVANYRIRMKLVNF